MTDNVAQIIVCFMMIIGQLKIVDAIFESKLLVYILSGILALIIILQTFL